jgi:hypothetical protein
MDTLRIVCTVLALAALVLPLGCAGQGQAYQPEEPLRLEGVSRTETMRAAGDALSRMHFVIEKLDAEQGVIRTEPLRGAQVFELWRSDNVGLRNTAEANLHTIRRAVELRIMEEQGRVSVDCSVRVQRLSLPENEAASISQAYQMHSASTPSVQQLQLTPQQRQGMAWIDLGQDRALAASILERIEKRLARAD